ncbi:MAG: aminoacyl-tRNA deacylase [Bryobacteraceae bacterium]
MAIAPKLKRFLDQNRATYTHHEHPTAYTAREVAAVERVPAHEVAKTVVFSDGDGYGMAVLPGDSMVDMAELREALGTHRLRLATEEEMQALFPDMEVGAMPPFGNLFDLPVYVDADLAQEQTITFNAGTHQDVVQMAYKDFERLVRPVTIHFAKYPAAL